MAHPPPGYEEATTAEVHEPEELNRLRVIAAQWGISLEDHPKPRKALSDAVGGLSPLCREKARPILEGAFDLESIGPGDNDRIRVELRGANCSVAEELARSIPIINHVDPTFIAREFGSLGIDILDAEALLHRHNVHGAQVFALGGSIPRTVRAATVFKGTLRHIAYALLQLADPTMKKCAAQLRQSIHERAAIIKTVLTQELPAALAGDREPLGE